MRIATRGSELALWQAKHVAGLLVAAGVCESPELVVVSTSGDRDKSTPLHEIGGKGVFVKEIQAAILDGRADIAVHSAKDMPAQTPATLMIGAVPERGEPRDALVGTRLADLPERARIATGSVRRRAQLASVRPDLEFADLRGNISTRLEKAVDFDAIVMAAAALERLDITTHPVDLVDAEVMVPQVGQGALAIECRVDDRSSAEALAAIDDDSSHRVLAAERGFLAELGGDCTLPAGAHGTLGSDGTITLAGFLASEDLLHSHRATVDGTDAVALGTELARLLRHALATGSGDK